MYDFNEGGRAIIAKVARLFIAESVDKGDVCIPQKTKFRAVEPGMTWTSK